MFWNIVHNDPSRSSKVIDFCTNRKRVYDFLFDLNSNLGPILPRFRDIRAFVRRKPFFSAPYPYSGENFWVFPLEQTRHVGVAKIERPRLTNGKLFLKNSNLCDHNSPTSQTDRQTDRQTDDMRSQYRALHKSASRGKNDYTSSHARFLAHFNVISALNTATDCMYSHRPYSIKRQWQKTTNITLAHWTESIYTDIMDNTSSRFVDASVNTNLRGFSACLPHSLPSVSVCHT